MAEPRVFFVNRVYWPSGEATAQLLADLAEGLAARGMNVYVVCAGTGDAERNGVRILRTDTPDTHHGLWSRARNYRKFIRGARARLATQLQPGDVVVALTDPPMLGAAMAGVASARGARLVHWTQDIYPEIAAVHFGPLAGLFFTPLRVRRDRAWRAADVCIALGEDMAALLAARGVAPNRLHLAPNWAPRELHDPVAPEAVAGRRAAWGCADRFVVAYSGNLGRVHEFATVLEAAERLRDESSIVFLFIGRGPRFADVEREARRRNLANVRFRPPEPRAVLAVALAAADAHLVTLLPRYAQLVYPSKLAGVLAAGRPVLFVGPPRGDIARLLRARDCGAAFAAGDAAGLADTIRRWQADRGHRERLGANARAAYLDQFQADAALDRWQARLRGLAGR